MNELKITRQASKTNAEGTEIVSDILRQLLAAGRLPALAEALKRQVGEAA